MGDQDTLGPEEAAAKKAIPDTEDVEGHRIGRWSAVPDEAGPDQAAAKKAIPDDAGPDEATKKHM